MKQAHVLPVFILLPLLLITAALVTSNCSGGSEPEVEEVRILIVHSYRLEYPWTQAVDDGIMYWLQDKGYRIERYFMRTKIVTEESGKEQVGQEALAKIKSFKPSVVITTDDNAQKYVGRFLVNRKDLSVVFCGVNGKAEIYGYPGNNVTGVLERPHIRNGLELLAKIVPNLKSISVFTDKSPTSTEFIRYVKSLSLGVKIDNVVSTDDFDHWKKQLSLTTSDAVMIYLYHTVRQQGKRVPPMDVMKWTVQNISLPTVGYLDFSIQDGVLLGHVESGYEHGQLAGEKCIKIINGKRASEIPITTAKKGVILVNEKTAVKLGIDISAIRNIADKIFQ